MQPRRFIVLLALGLTACGDSTSSPQPATPLTGATSADPMADASATTGPAGTSDVDMAIDPLSAVTLVGTDGRVWTHGGTRGALDGVVAADGRIVVATAPSSGQASVTVAWRDVSADETLAAFDVGSDLRVRAVSGSGDLAVLSDAQVGGTAPSTHVVAVDRRAGVLGDWMVPGNLVPEAFADAFAGDGSGLPIGIFVIEYVRPEVYRVRVLDTASGALSLPLNLRDKARTVDEAMEAIGRTAAFDSVNRLLFTLYQGVPDGDLPTTAFVHTLGLINGVYCLDLPADLALGDLPGAVSVDPWGRRLYVASPNGGIAAFTIRDILDPAVVPVAEPIAWFEAGSSVALLASQDAVHVAINGAASLRDGQAALILDLDPATLQERSRIVVDGAVEAMAMTVDDELIVAGEGRLRVLAATGETLHEVDLPVDVGTVVNLSVHP
jgi:hypothetical protein